MRGANDYMEKPFHLQELEARVRSLTRRKFVQKNVCLECGSLRFDTKERTAYAKDKPVALTRKENGILEYLLLNQGRPVSQEELIRACLGILLEIVSAVRSSAYVFSEKETESRTWL